jgi:hypothetical protein
MRRQSGIDYAIPRRLPLVLRARFLKSSSSGSIERQALTLSASTAVGAALKFVMVPLVDLRYHDRGLRGWIIDVQTTNRLFQARTAFGGPLSESIKWPIQ